ncbi:MAG: hypothetical protein KJ655_00930, partial [Candidatus Thermoplasmatota archaeon]|nr:hypothetical protein [Candidatus Thermoplasmatota archaeon]
MNFVVRHYNSTSTHTTSKTFYMERTIDALTTMKQDIKCPRCKNEFVVNISGQPGTYAPTCPKCNYKFRIKLKVPLLSLQ